MHKKNLLKLAEFLEKVPLSLFEIEGWITVDSFGKFDGTYQCGFAGCAIGWATHAELFDGLKFSGGSPSYKGNTGPDAVAKLFEAEWEQLRELFMIDAYQERPSPHDVAERIRLFVKD